MSEERGERRVVYRHPHPVRIQSNGYVVMPSKIRSNLETDYFIVEFDGSVVIYRPVKVEVKPCD